MSAHSIATGETTGEFHYRLDRRISGYRPGSHPGLSLGTGQDFAAHARLFDHPDPRRLDLRASIRNPRGDWLVRTYQQRASINLQAVVDVSPSMLVGSAASKLAVAADFVESMGRSAFQVGDSAGLIAFDHQVRHDLFLPPRYSRGGASQMGQRLRELNPPLTHQKPTRIKPADHVLYGQALNDAVRPLTGKKALIFLISDYHWPLKTLESTLESLTEHTVIPVVIWDHTETEPPAKNGLLSLRDSESGQFRPVWMNEQRRQKWRTAVSERKSEIRTAFKTANAEPLYLSHPFNPEVLSRYFLEERT
ncbi:MAG: DUF58 domain-containing protein [Burkholderiaceae bacterium]